MVQLRTDRSTLVLAAVAAVLAAGQAQAQSVSNPPVVQTESSAAVRTRAIEVTASTVAVPVASTRGVDAGAVRVTSQAIEDTSRASGDATALLRVLPSAQFDLEQHRGRREDLQDIRPEEFTLSGGRTYENLITIDGLDVGTRLDADNTNAFNFNETTGAAAQSQWVDTSLLGELVVRDANVSAEFGSFTGGVVEARTRNPLGAFSARASIRCTNTGQTSFIINEPTRAALGSAQPVQPPDYERCGVSASLDLPTLAGFDLLLAATETFSSVQYFRSAAYGGGPFDQESRSSTFQLKASRQVGNFARMELQLAHAPYQTEAANANARNNQIVSFGGGNRASLRLESDAGGLLGAQSWNLQLGWVDNDSSRRAPANNFSWPTAAPLFASCTTSTNCIEGGFGDIDQSEQTLSLLGQMSWELPTGNLRAGFSASRIDAAKTRPQTNRAYSLGTSATNGRGFVGTTVVCLDQADVACIQGQVALGQYQEYRAYDIDVSLESVAIWGEWQVPLGPFEFRAGLRAENDSFTGNTDAAPRLAASWTYGPATLALGANRYFSKSFLGYAFREQEPNSFTYGRLATTVSGQQRFANGWPLVRESRSVSFRQADLETPYSDELMAQIDADLPRGVGAMLRYTNRAFRNEIVMAPGTSATVVGEAGTILTTTVRTPSNDGKSSYEGVRLELRREFGRDHAVLFAAEASQRRQSGEGRFVTFDDDLASQPAYLFGADVLSLAQLVERNELANFATPTVATASWTGRWFSGRLTSNLSARWSDGYQRIEETGATAVVNGQRLAVVDLIDFDARWTADLKLNVGLIREGRIGVDYVLDITNLFDGVQSQAGRALSQPYERGRVVWTGVSVRY